MTRCFSRFLSPLRASTSRRSFPPFDLPLPFLALLVGVLGVLAFTYSPPANAAPLPEGNAPPALSFPHFPDRQHAFVWRNWGLVEPGRLAQVLKTSEQNV